MGLSWQPIHSPPAALRDTVAFARRAVDASYLDKVTVTIGGEKLARVRGQRVLPDGPDRNLGGDEIGCIRLAAYAVPAEA